MPDVGKNEMNKSTKLLYEFATININEDILKKLESASETNIRLNTYLNFLEEGKNARSSQVTLSKAAYELIEKIISN